MRVNLIPSTKPTLMRVRQQLLGPYSSVLAVILLLAIVLMPCGCREQSGAGAGAPAADGQSSSGPSEAAPVADDSRIDVGLQLLKENRLGEAGMIFDSVVNEHPDLARANFYKGLVLHRRQLHGTALSWYEGAMELEQEFPERTKVPYYTAWCYYYVGKMGKAKEMIELFLEEFPDRADAHFLVGVIALEDGRMEVAQESLEHAIELASGDPESERSMARAWVRLSDVHAQAGRYDDALVAVNGAIALRPALSQAWFRKYTILMRLGVDDEEAEFARQRWKDLAATGGATIDAEP